MTADEIRRILKLEPLTIEGGYFRETYRAPRSIPCSTIPSFPSARSLATAIYYLLTPDTFSRLHRVPGEEIFHFYLGDPVEMLQLHTNGDGALVTLGSDLAAGMSPQVVVSGGVWQGARLRDNGQFALLGTTMAPGFDYADYEIPDSEELVRRYPDWERWIRELTPAG